MSYFQGNKWEGVFGQIWQIYFWFGMSGLRRFWRFWGLDKIFGNAPEMVQSEPDRAVPRFVDPVAEVLPPSPESPGRLAGLQEG